MIEDEFRRDMKVSRSARWIFSLVNALLIPIDGLLVFLIWIKALLHGMEEEHGKRP